MVVVSGGWVKNIAQYPPTNNIDNNNEMVIPTDNMSAKAVLICRPNSHPFQDRTLCLDQPVKVGRSVARAKATQTNAIFDCKVLSRHHAVLWYDCGKFYLQDTKSSNGTFVNNNRLSTKDSEPQEVSSGDIVQFGVDVVETGNRKVTHGCIIAALKLYLPDGKEAKASPSLIDSNKQETVPLEDLYELNQVFQEILQRELCLETKLLALNHAIVQANRYVDECYQVYVGEERLLSRIAALEAQLGQVAKNINDEKLKEELQKLHEDRIAYQEAAKESLRKLLAERVESDTTSAEHQRARATAEQESMLCREELEKVQKQVQEVVQKLSDERKKMEEEKTVLEQKNHSLEAKLDEEREKVTELQLKLSIQEMERRNLIIEENDIKLKEELIENCDNENTDSDNYRPNGEPEQNQLNITHDLNERKVQVHFEEKLLQSESATNYRTEEPEQKLNITNESERKVHFLEKSESESSLTECDTQDETAVTMIENDLLIKTESKELSRHDSGTIVDDTEENPRDTDEDETDDLTDKEHQIHHVYSKTLKYQFQSAQNELRRQIENLEQLVRNYKEKNTLLEDELKTEKDLNINRSNEIEKLENSIGVCMEKYKEVCNENQQLKDHLNALNEQLKVKNDQIHENEQNKNTFNTNQVTQMIQQLLNLEDELVKLKEKFASLNEENMILNKELTRVREQYKEQCNKSQNTVFIYVAPLVLLLLYMFVSSLFS